MTKYASSRPKNLLISVLLLVSMLLTIGCSNPSKIKLNDTASFYVVSEKGITGYHIDEVGVSDVAQTKVNIIRDNINPVVQRAELNNQHLMLTEDGWPSGKTEGIVSIDLKSGDIQSLSTNHIAYTAAGSSNKYYLAVNSGIPTTIWVYTPSLKEISSLELESPAVFSDFYSDGDQMYAIGVDVDNSYDESGNPYFKTNLFHFAFEDENLVLKSITELQPNPGLQDYLTDTIVKGDYLYSLNAGQRNYVTYESTSTGNVYKYDLVQKTGEFIPLPQAGPSNAYFLEPNLIAITHSVSLGSTNKGVTIFNIDSNESSFVNLDELGITFEYDQVLDVKRLQDKYLVMLTDKQVIIYDMAKGRIAYEVSCDTALGLPFHVWIAK